MRQPAPYLEPEAVAVFSDDGRRAVYDAISLRRDVRHFRPEPDIDPAALERILAAAHAAPSVGFSQPWGFVLVRDRTTREHIRDSFLKCREAEAIRFPADRREAYLGHKLEGILEAPLNVCVTVDLRDRGEAILGTTVQPEAVRASACCAVENLWLAARVEGIGVGWVSIVEPAVLRSDLALPAGVEPIAYLCVGHPIAFRGRPMLEETGWLSRRPLADVVHIERWAAGSPSSGALVAKREHPSRVITPIDERAKALAKGHQAGRTKPAESLGRLEELATLYAAAHGVFPPPPLDRAVVAVFAADHGVVVEGVSAYGSQLTAATVANVMAGSAAINAIAAESDVEILLTDVGVAGDLVGVPTAPRVALRRSAVRAGTNNLRHGPAMLRAQVEEAIEVGAAVARDAVKSGARAVGLGEIGIGNTTSAAALTCVFAGREPRAIVGRGTGIGNDVLARKVDVVASALAFHRPDPSDPIGVLAQIGGLEIAALVGCALESASLRIPVILDGFVTNIAALVAARLDPTLRGYLVAAHASPEPGTAVVLAELGLVPLFDLGMRLGEGTGAALALSLLRTAVHTQLAMASFATAGIVGRAGMVTEP